MTDACERTEILLSSWMDEELERQEAREMMDHLVRCKSCREFYRRARALEGVVVAAGMAAGSDPVPSTEVWQRIEESTGRNSSRRVGTWMLRAAALVIVGLALMFVVAPRMDSGVQTAAPNELAEIEVELGSRSGEMTEERFFEIATEILESDRRYQQAMLKVMDSVIDDQPATEGGGDTVTARGEGPRKGENTGGRA